jgi:putative acetyltransferase
MIRKFNATHTDSILEIWLQASIQAHSFIDRQFWQSQVENMRNIYLPSSDVFVDELENTVTGFYALHNETLAALFVGPQWQGQGIGQALLAHAKTQRATLNLNVYKANERSCRFYLQAGFREVGEQIDVHTGHPELLMSL